MRLAILSDIHGNFQALQAVLADLDGSGVDAVLSLGDNIGYGPQPEEVVQTLMARRIDSVIGNHELALSSVGYLLRLNPHPRISLEISRELMSRESLNYCLALPVSLVRHGARFVHGCPPESTTTYLWNPSEARMARIFATFAEPLCFFGHTHALAHFAACGQHYEVRQAALQTRNLAPDCRYLINPGSVGQPRDDFNNLAKYGIWDREAHAFIQRAVPYDVQQTVSLLKQRNFPQANADRLLW
ncbi:MAG: metallophosphoesterase [Desulfurivibrio sp.]|nr:MAG: metallophosphoesterase [Desulfurivibrio sp.]